MDYCSSTSPIIAILCLQVLESWRVILRGMPMDISLEDVRVCARDGAAFVTCVEIMEAGDSRGRCISAHPSVTHTCLALRIVMISFHKACAADALQCCNCVGVQGK